MSARGDQRAAVLAGHYAACSKSASAPRRQLGCECCHRPTETEGKRVCLTCLVGCEFRAGLWYRATACPMRARRRKGARK